MARIIIPIVIILLIVGGVFAYLKFGRGMGNKVDSVGTTSNVAEQKIPVTGNPDDIAATVEKSAADEQTAVSAEENDAASVTADDSEINAIDETVNENEF